MQMERVKSRPESKMSCGPSHSVIVDKGVLIFDWCPPDFVPKIESDLINRSSDLIGVKCHR